MHVFILKDAYILNINKVHAVMCSFCLQLITLQLVTTYVCLPTSLKASSFHLALLLKEAGSGLFVYLRKNFFILY
ncbi:hypothetical protein JHK82_033079 [Glycine max]|uniref:Uncharacterized protein n=1 Tax=Glycine max TaxID=3847 RepID=A0A0R0H301_SOYBN|nr:hypothetical protein JHK87_033019 [Glycine soja]KAG4979832.1 hypothetical protein JHK85_033790 [Glycine max]KAG5118659.1 hypothetical protein JHK82_033079 [Glycine max]KAG5139649.1 hypothetical protein JHK84_033417 [Glycine max]KAH1142128.1 hypothetical protein GYH30_033009 [Glycine max]